MIRCQQCNTDNLDGSEFCDECGTRLTAVASVRSVAMPPASPPPPPQFVAPPQFVKESAPPKPAMPYAPPPVAPVTMVGMPVSAVNNPATSAPPNLTVGTPGRSNAQTSALNRGNHPTMLEENSGALSAARAKLVIQRGGKIGKEFPLLEADSLIGRWDADGGIFPDVDLDQDDPEAKVSRRHARIQQQNNQFLIEDLGSTNGTFVNRGPRLLPGNRQPLKNGDEVIVGKTFLKFVQS